MWTDDVVCAFDDAFAAIRGEDDDWGDRGLESPVQVSEALDVQHVNLVDEQNSGNQLGDAFCWILGKIFKLINK